MFKDNPQYNKVISSNNGTDFYMLKDFSQYHMSRFLAASANDRYARLGLTPDVMYAIEENILKATELKNWADIAVWVNNLRARRSEPVDEFAALRMASIYSFIDGEDPEKCEPVWNNKKFQLIKEEPALFSFFLNIGLQFTPSYQDLLKNISETSLKMRRDVLNQLTPVTLEPSY